MFLLAPEQAVARTRERLGCEPRLEWVGVSGPGEPLANTEATLATFSQLRGGGIDLRFFVQTNGLGLENHVDQLVSLGVSLGVVTVNALDPRVGSQLLEWVRGPAGLLTGEDAARWLAGRQLAGIRRARARGMVVWVKFQLLPTVNDGHVDAVAFAVGEAGADAFTVEPLELRDRSDGGSRFAAIPSPSARDLCHLRETAAAAFRRGRSSSASRPAHHCDLVDRLEVANEAEAGDWTDPHPRGAPASSQQELAERAVALPQLQFIARVARWLATSEHDTLTTLTQVLVWLEEQMGLCRGVLVLADPAGDTLQAQVVHGFDPEQIERMRYRAGEGVTGRVFATGRAVIVPVLAAHGEFLDRSGGRAAPDPARVAFFCVPLRDRSSIIGTLSVDKDNTQLKDADSDLNLLQEVAHLLAPFLQKRRLEENLSLFRQLRSTDGPSARLIGRSPVMDEVRQLIAKVAPTNTTVLLEGETGTGKTVAAELVHELSPRAQGPFVEVNCGSIPESLIESELFGHERGAFTGAVTRRLGVFERARGGTVFLDEVGELQPAAQTRLLRVLQTRRFERVGGAETLTTDARLIAATNRDLSRATDGGSFRTDLYYRLNVFPIVMPPLRERGKADLILLADGFVDRFGSAMKKPIFRIDTPAIDMITAYHWPGNVRELENVIERAVVLAEGEVLHGHHLPPSLQLNRYAPQPESMDFTARVRAFETQLITQALKEANGNQTRAAESLGLTKRIIQYKIRAYDIQWRRFLPKG